jgi:hypothetical protein
MRQYLSRCQTYHQSSFRVRCPITPLYFFALNATPYRVPETLYLQKITQMSDRIQQLEEALANLQSTLSNEPHPLLTDELLKIKYLSERPESEEFLASQDLSIMGQPTRPEGGEINIDVIRDADATSFHSSEVGFPSMSCA